MSNYEAGQQSAQQRIAELEAQLASVTEDRDLWKQSEASCNEMYNELLGEKLLAEAQLATVRVQLQVAKEALEAVEWIECFGICCPWCRACKEKGHALDCKRQQALAAIAEKEGK